MLKALIIDFDGVIIDTERVHFDVNQIWFKDKLGIELPLDDYVVCVGANLQVLLDHINQKYATDLTVADIPDDGHAEVERRTNELPLLPCVRELIDAAKERGLLVTLCTSSRRARAMNSCGASGSMNSLTKSRPRTTSHGETPSGSLPQGPRKGGRQARRGLSSRIRQTGS